MIAKRIFDFFTALIGFLLLSPLFLILAISIKLDSKGSIFYIAKRVGKGEKEFSFLKFRTMRTTKNKSTITVGDRDPRVTRVGYYLRKFKLDELPQLLNILLGDLSFVGPRPDDAKYKEHYKNVFPDYYKMKPGITSYSTIFFSNEVILYTNVKDPEIVYIEKTIPKKVELDLKYYKSMNIITDIKLIIKTALLIFKQNTYNEDFVTFKNEIEKQYYK